MDHNSLMVNLMFYELERQKKKFELLAYTLSSTYIQLNVIMKRLQRGN